MAVKNTPLRGWRDTIDKALAMHAANPDSIPSAQPRTWGALPWETQSSWQFYAEAQGYGAVQALWCWALLKPYTSSVGILQGHNVQCLGDHLEFRIELEISCMQA